MQNARQLITAALATALIGTAAWAGEKSAYPVTVYSTSREAFGSLGSTRDTADTFQKLGCQVNTSSTGSTSVYCYAQSASAVGACLSSSAALVEAVRSIQGDSYLYFSWDASGNCTNINVTHGSQYAPKQP
ncbi:hypothetical protein MFUL124B02_01260 [Myxococcus fulvus 124B02]|nr:hypothetical protein MFUL124B02_01260 [Myxococcus fulvus 124B02]